MIGNEAWPRSSLQWDRIEAWISLAAQIEPFAIRAFPEIAATQLRVRLA